MVRRQADDDDISNASRSLENDLHSLFGELTMDIDFPKLPSRKTGKTTTTVTSHLTNKKHVSRERIAQLAHEAARIWETYVMYKHKIKYNNFGRIDDSNH